MKMLVPIDGSEQSEKALNYASNLQQNLIYDIDNSSSISRSKKRKEIIVLSIIPHFHIPLGFEKPMKSFKTGEKISLNDYIKEMNEAIRSEWADKISDVKRKYESDKISIRTEIHEAESGSVAENIIKFADKEDIDLIVIGNVGLGGISKIKALGSVSRKVSEMANCSVLIVH
jgi:nucleotide-binding universal stress UspA family protein